MTAEEIEQTIRDFGEETTRELKQVLMALKFMAQTIILFTNLFLLTIIEEMMFGLITINSYCCYR